MENKPCNLAINKEIEAPAQAAQSADKEYFLLKGRHFFSGYDQESGDARWTRDVKKALPLCAEELERLKSLFEKQFPDEVFSQCKASKFNLALRLERQDGIVVYVRKMDKETISMCDLKRNAHRFKSRKTATAIMKEYLPIFKEAGYEKIEVVELED